VQPEDDPRSELELDKLRLEIQELKNRNKWYGQPGQFLPFLTILTAVIGLVISNYQFDKRFQEDRSVREADAKTQAERDTKSREDEFRKPFWEARLKLYLEATEAAATIANLSPTDPERKKAEQKFMTLYWGPMVSVEDPADSRAMVDFERCLRGLGEECKTERDRSFRLKELSFDLANRFRKSLGASWSVELKDLPMQE
jgi:hypothetical protein